MPNSPASKTRRSDRSSVPRGAGVKDRVAPTDDDIAVARSRVAESRRRVIDGESVSAISQSYHVPVRAVEVSLVEAPPAPTAPPSPRARPEPAEEPQRPSPLEQLSAVFGTGRPKASEVGAASDALGTDLAGDLAYQGVKERLRAMKLENDVMEARAEQIRRGADRPADDDRAPRWFEKYSDKTDGRLTALETRVVGAPVAVQAQSQREFDLQREVDRLKQRAEHQEDLARAVGPLYKELETLKSRPAPRQTLTDVEVADAERTSVAKSKIATEGLEQVVDRLKDAPRVLAKVDRVADMVLDTPVIRQAVHGRVQEGIERFTGKPVENPLPEFDDPRQADAYVRAVLDREEMREGISPPPPPSGRRIPTSNSDAVSGVVGIEVR